MFKVVLTLGTTAIPNANKEYCVCAVYYNGEYEYKVLSVKRGQEIPPGRILTTATGTWLPTLDDDIAGLLRIANRYAVTWTLTSAPDLKNAATRWCSPGVFDVFWYSGGSGLPRSPGCSVEILKPCIVRLGFAMKLVRSSADEPYYQPEDLQNGEWKVKYDGFLADPDTLPRCLPCGALLALFVAPHKYSGGPGQHHAYLKIGSVLSASAFDSFPVTVSVLAEDVYVVLLGRVALQSPQIAYSELRKLLPHSWNNVGDVPLLVETRWRTSTVYAAFFSDASVSSRPASRSRRAATSFGISA